MMKADGLKARLSEILADEEEAEVDWNAVLGKSADLLSELPIAAPPVAQEYLHCVDRRRLDCVFAHAQRTELLRYLRAA